ATEGNARAGPDFRASTTACEIPLFTSLPLVVRFCSVVPSTGTLKAGKRPNRGLADSSCVWTWERCAALSDWGRGSWRKDEKGPRWRGPLESSTFNSFRYGTPFCASSEHFYYCR